ncbi:MAG: hypothetical protein QOI10_742 [Solirubrobacterales bacterium]|jgi:uncharacterized protein|nr:hypothetical protein [Solirubrobacterales bacterium]
MAAYTTIELARIAPSPGDGKRLEFELEPGQVELGGHTYEFSPPLAGARLEISRTASGYALRLTFAGEVIGPCMRCLGPAAVEIAVEAREVDQPGTDDEELRSPYVTEGELDLNAWGHDSLVLAMPQRLLCRPDCAGLCAVCGESLNDAEPGAHHHPSEPDPRWDKLRELQ